jgi:hypothetical protein
LPLVFETERRKIDEEADGDMVARFLKYNIPKTGKTIPNYHNIT